MSDKAWSGKTGGTRWMQQSLICIFRRIDPIFVYPIVWIWICFYILLGSKGRKGIWHYWHDRMGYSWPRAAVNLYLNYFEFGKVILDRFAAYSGRKFDFELKNHESLQKLLDKPEGFIVLGTHLGNQELAGYIFKMAKPMYALIYMGDTQTINENRTKMFERMGLHIIPVQSDGSHVLEMHNALCNGNILSIHADRLFYDSKAIYSPILGENAAFPEGPFRVATAEQVPVVSLFMMRERHGRYTLHVRILSDGTYTEHGSRAQAKALLQRYIEVNEEMIRLYPRQWFHFYEFWQN